MLRTPLTLTAVALMLTLGACSGGGGDRPSTPAAGNGGSDADNGGDTIKPGNNSGASNGGNTGGSTGGTTNPTPVPGDNTGGTTDPAPGGNTGGGTDPADPVPGGNTGGSPAAEPLLAGNAPIEAALKTGEPVFFTARDSDVGNKIKVEIDQEGTITLTDVTAGTATAFGQAQALETRDGLVSYLAGDGPAVALDINDLGGEVMGQQLDYTAFGVWGSTAALPDSEDAPVVLSDVGTYYGGLRTDSAAMPTTGTAAYAGAVDAIEYDAASRLVVNDLTGAASLAADFGNNKLSGSMSLVQENGDAWGTLKLGTVAITGNGFKGGITSNRGHKTGSVDGHFFGPNADEIGGQFGIGAGSSGTATTEIRGAFGAKK
ncbi:MAG: transferrin-binding protein-like solute binding protein [Geminicoccaceae bacterium]|nr:transferrin-binding protein-like solute binding protein [Geminicoccaceae bacterium]